MPSSILLDPAWRGDAPIPSELTLGEKPEEKLREGRWPRMLNLDVDVKDTLVEFLEHELMQCFSERQILVEDWTQWQTDYWAKPEQKEKNFPFRRAANIVIPLTAIAVEAVYARLINTLFSVEPFWSVRPRTKEWVEAAPVVEEWFQTEAEGQLDVYKFCSESLLELIKLGTAVGKSGFERDVRKSLTTIAGKEVERWVEIKNGATLFHVPLANFLIRLFEKDPQQATWVGEEHVWNWSQIKRMCLSGQFKKSAIEDIKSWWTTTHEAPSASGDYERAKDQAGHTEPAWHEVFRTQEIWLSFDIDKDGVDEEIVVDYHRDSRIILSARYNWYDDLHRPYRHCNYMPVEGRFYGIGIGKQNEQFQKLITTIHRQRLDNQTLANMMQLAIKKTAGYGPGEPLFPGKLWFLDNPREDIIPLKVSDTYLTQVNHEDYARTYSERRTGVNEVVLGMPHEGTPGTATSDTMRLAEGNKKFDMTLRNVRRWLGPLGTDTLANYQQFGDNQRHWLKMGRDKGQVIEQILALPPQLVRDGAIVEVTVTDSITNKEVQRQQWMALFAVLSQYYDRQVQTAALLQSPELLLMMGQASLEAGDYLIRRLIETFREASIDPEQLLLYPKLTELLNAQAQELTGGADSESQGVSPASRMAQLLATGGIGGGGAQQGTPQRNGQRSSVGPQKSNGGAPSRS